MADETRTANVNITADVSGYSQGTQQAAQSTNKLIESVNKLSTSLDGITKRAGKKLLLFSAADLAVMTGFTLAAAKYEKQMSTLAAQAVLGNKNIQEYTKGINSLAKSMPVARGEIAQLVTQIEHLGVTSAKQSVAMASVFEKMAATTGEDVGQLTASLIELSRTMGTLNNGASGISNFADSIVSISANAGVSATAVISFAQSIAPLARAAGIGQKELLGISTAFTKAGADGFAASNAFSTIIADVNRLTMSGSPEIAKYANAIGITVDQFKRMGATDQFIAIVDSVNKAGPKAVQILNDMGIDGTRAAKAFAALSSESGGLRKAVEDAVSMYGNGNNNSASAAAFDTLDAKSTQLRNNLEQMAAAIGSAMLPVAKALLDVFNNILSTVNNFAEPILKVAGGLASIVGVLSGVGGTMLTALGPLSTLMMAMTLFRLSPMRAMFSGVKDAVGTIRATPMNPYTSSQFGNLQRAGMLPLYQSGPYRAGEMLGGLAGRLPPGAAMLSRAAGTGVLRTVESFARANNVWYDNARRMPWDRVSMLSRTDAVQPPAPAPLPPSLANMPAPRPIAGLSQSVIGESERLKGLPPAMSGRTLAWNALTNPRAFLSGLTQRMPDEFAGMSAKERLANFDAYKKSLLDQAKATATNTAETIKEAGSKKSLVQATGGATRAMLAYPMAASRMGVSVAGQALRAPFAMLGSMLGMGAGAGGLLAGAGLGYMAWKKQNDSLTVENDGMRNIAAINAKLGIATEPLNDFAASLTKANSEIKSLGDAMAITATRARGAYGGEYTDQNIKGLPDKRAAVAYLRSLGPMNAQQGAIAMQDIANRFGYEDAKEIGNRYMAETQGGTNNRYDSSVIKELTSGTLRTSIASRGWMQGMLAQSPEEAGKAWDNVLTTINEQADRYGSETDSKGRNVGEMVKGQGLETMLNEALAPLQRREGESQVEWEARFNQNTVNRKQGIKALESRYGEFGIDVNDQRLWDVKTGDQFADYLRTFAPNKGAANKFLEQYDQGGISALDLANILKYNPAAKDETALAGTTMGRFMRSDATISAVMNGDTRNDPREVAKAIRILGDAAIKTTGNFEDASIELITAQTAIGDTSSPKYLLAQAAQQRAAAIGSYQASTQGGWAGSQSFNWRQSRAGLFGSDPNAAQEQMRGQQLEVQQRIAQTVIQLEEYQISKRRNAFDQQRQIDIAETQNNRTRLRAFQDFARQMGRAAVDFAKNMHDPYQRVSNAGVTSLDFLIANGKQQLEVVRQQNRDVARLRKLGMSQETIDAFGFNDPARAYQTQLARQQAMQDPNKIKEMEKVTKGKIGAGTNLMEQQTGYQNQQEDFMRQMNRGAFDFAVQMKLSAEAFNRSTTRAQQDMNRLSKEATGDIATLWLQAQGLADSLGLSNSAFMTQMSKFLTDNPDVFNDTGPVPGAIPTGKGVITKPNDTLGSAWYGGQRDPNWYSYQNTLNDKGKVTGTNVAKLPENWDAMTPAQLAKWQSAGRPGLDNKSQQMIQQQIDLALNRINTTFAPRPGNVFGQNVQDSMELGFDPDASQISGETKVGMGVGRGAARSVRSAGFSKGVPYKGGSTVITNSTHYTVTGDIRADDPEKLARELKKRERNDNRRKGANAKVSA